MIQADKARHIDGLGEALVTTKAAARWLAVSERTLWTLAQTGQIPSVRIGRAVRFDPEDLAAFVEQRKGGAKQEARKI